MSPKSPWNYLPPAGPVLSFLLIGLVLLSALLYYRAVKIQRFLEPALALSQPRNEFGKNISRIFQDEFGMRPINGLTVKTNSIFIERSLLFTGNGSVNASAKDNLRRLARIFSSLMKDDHARSEISLVLIIARFTSFGARGANVAERAQAQRMVGFIQDALFGLEPVLGVRYSTYFGAVALPVDPHEGNRDVVEFRIIPSEFLHVEVLEKLEKYAF